MQSSTAIAIRALVMLIVLISVPLVAIFGKSLPDVLKGLLEGRTLVLSPAPAASPTPSTPAPTPLGNNTSPFGQSTPYRADASANAGRATPPGSPASNTARPDAARLLSASTPPAPAPQKFPDLAMSANPGSPLPAAPTSNATPSGDWRNPVGPQTGLQPAEFQTRADGRPAELPRDGNNPFGDLAASGSQRASVTPATSPYAGNVRDNTPPNSYGKNDSALGNSDNSPPPTTGDSRFRQTEIRLRELGATHYMLETWGPDNNSYRFVCKMSIGGNAGVNRYFQATDEDPWRAMNSVLHQIEDWRSQPQQ